MGIQFTDIDDSIWEIFFQCHKYTTPLSGRGSLVFCSHKAAVSIYMCVRKT